MRAMCRRETPSAGSSLRRSEHLYEWARGAAYPYISFSMQGVVTFWYQFSAFP